MTLRMPFQFQTLARGPKDSQEPAAKHLLLDPFSKHHSYHTITLPAVQRFCGFNLIICRQRLNTVRNAAETTRDWIQIEIDVVLQLTGGPSAGQLVKAVVFSGSVNQLGGLLFFCFAGIDFLRSHEQLLSDDSDRSQRKSARKSEEYVRDTAYRTGIAVYAQKKVRLDGHSRSETSSAALVGD